MTRFDPTLRISRDVTLATAANDPEMAGMTDIISDPPIERTTMDIPVVTHKPRLRLRDKFEFPTVNLGLGIANALIFPLTLASAIISGDTYPFFWITPVLNASAVLSLCFTAWIAAKRSREQSDNNSNETAS